MPKIKRATAPTPATTSCPLLHAWEIFNECEIEACENDSCEICPNDGSDCPHTFGIRNAKGALIGFNDESARAHIAACDDCQRKLGNWLIGRLMEVDAYGVWTVDPTVHEGHHVDQADARRLWREA